MSGYDRERSFTCRHRTYGRLAIVTGMDRTRLGRSVSKPGRAAFESCLFDSASFGANAISGRRGHPNRFHYSGAKGSRTLAADGAGRVVVSHHTPRPPGDVSQGASSSI